MKKKKTDSDANAGSAYVKPSTKKHQPVDIVKGSYGGYSLYYVSLYYSLYYVSLYYSY